jgi:hypothetical protein
MDQLSAELDGTNVIESYSYLGAEIVVTVA